MIIGRWLRRGPPGEVGAAGTGPERPGDAPAEAAREACTLSAVQAERLRIYQDLHDDIGARLVSILSLSSDARIQQLARDALSDLREVVYHARGEPATLTQVLGEIRAELAGRLEQGGWQLAWIDSPLPEVVLPGEATIHLYRIVREAATNAIKHARPGVLRVRVRHAEGMMYLDVTDQGRGDDHPVIRPGSGHQGMRQRAKRMGGQLDIEPGTLCGTKVVLRFPLPGMPALTPRS